MVVTPLARRLVLMLTSFALVFALIWAGMMTYAHGLETRIARDWMDLVERCRTAIETGIPLDTAGLEPAQIISMPPSSRPTLHKRLLSHPGGRYVIEEEEFAAGDGVERSCRVAISDYRIGPTKREAAVLYYDFLQLMTGLLIAETHWQAEILPIPQMALRAFEPRAPKNEGCMVKSVVIVALETHDIEVTTAEMPGCSGPSMLSGTAA